MSLGAPLRCIPLLVLFQVWVVSFAWPDTVSLQNGDRISGTLVRIDQGKAVISTEYAGEIAIALEQVSFIETEEALSVSVEGEEDLGEVTFQRKDDEQYIQSGDYEIPIDLSNVTRAAQTEDAFNQLVKQERKRNRLWNGFVDAGLSIRRGEQDTFDTTLGAAVTRKVPSNTLTLKFDAAYGEAEDNVDTQRIRGDGKWQFYPTKTRFFYYGSASAEHDRPRLLELRLTGGGGVGYDFIDRERRKLTADIGLEYAYERWENFAQGERGDLIEARRTAAFRDLSTLVSELNAGALPLTFRSLFRGVNTIRRAINPDVPDAIRTEDDINARASVFFQQSLFENTILTDELNLFPSITNFGEVRVTNDLTLTTPISDRLRWRLNLRTEFESDPGSSRIEELDNRLVTGLRYEF